MSTPHPLRELLSPLAIAAYAGWTAVFIQAGAQLGARDPALGWGARALMLLYLLGFLREMFADEDRSRLSAHWGVALMVAAAVAVLALGPAGTSPILMVIASAVLGARLGDRALLAVVASLVAVTALLLHLRWGIAPGSMALQMVSFASFMAFAAVVLRQATRAETLATQLRETNARLLSTRSLLSETARDSERLRLSRELHDVAGHKLTALKLNLGALARDPELAGRAEIDAMLGLSDELLQDLRALVQQLRHHDGIDLREAFSHLAAALPRPRTRIEVADDARIPHPDQAEVLLRVAQEGLTNSARHGAAARAWLTLQPRDGHLELCLDDDGRLLWPLREGNGLTGMRERVEALGGELQLQPSPRGGLRLCARLPLEPDA